MTGSLPVGDVNVIVDAAVAVRTVDPNFASCGVTIWNFASDPTKPDMQDYPHIAEFTRMIRNRVSRYGGGNWANSQGFTRRTDRFMERYQGAPWATTVDSDPASITFGNTYGYRHVYTPAMLASLDQWARESWVHAMVQCNLLDSNPVSITHDDGVVETFAGGMWADMVRFCNIEKGYGFRYWELGNEYDFVKPWGHTGAQHAIAAREMARRFARQYAAMKAVDPSIRIGFPAIANPTENNQDQYTWMKVLSAEMKALGVTPDFISWHFYGNQNATGPQSPDPDFGWSPEAVMSYDEYVSGSQFGTPGSQVPLSGGGSWIVRGKRIYAELQVQKITAIWQADHGAVPPMWITEWAEHAGTGAEPPHRHLITVPWLVDVGMRLRDEGVSGLMYYNLFEEENSNGMLFSNGYRISLYALLMLNQLVGNNVLNVGSDLKGFGGHGSKDLRGTWVHLVNTTDQPQDVSVLINGLAASDIDRVTVWKFIPEVGWTVDAGANDASINGWRPSIAMTAEDNLDNLYAAGQVTQLSGNRHVERLEPWQPAVLCFSNKPVVAPPPIQPIASAVVGPLGGDAPHLVEVLSDASRGAITRWEIDPGDGSPLQSFQSAPVGFTHTYQQPSGTAPYALTYRVVGPGGTHSQTFSVSVSGETGQPPGAAFEISFPDPNDFLLHRFRFNGVGSPSEFEWSVFAEPLGGNVIGTGTGPEFDFSFPSEGEYLVELTVRNPFGEDTTNSTVRVVAPPGPVAAFNVVVRQDDPLLITVNDQSRDSETVQYDFGDQLLSPELPAQHPPHDHRYAQPGVYTITQTVEDSFGRTAETSTVVAIVAQPDSGGGIGAGALVAIVVLGGLALGQE